jgi:hypothetical protein
MVEGGATIVKVKLALVNEPPVSLPPAETVKLVVPTGVAAVVVIVSVVVLVVPEPEKVAGVKLAATPAGALPPGQLIDQLPEQLPLLLFNVMFV